MPKSVPLHTACCGIYCPDCIRFRNGFSPLAGGLRDELGKARMRDYAGVRSPFGDQSLASYPAFLRVLDSLTAMHCEKTCREQGGCGGVPCAIMQCCAARNFSGCWQCPDLEECDRFDFLAPRCGDMPKTHCRTIREHGLENWESRRARFYRWS